MCSPTEHSQSFRRQKWHSFPASSTKWQWRYKSRASSPGDPASKVQKQSNPHPGLKINKQSWQILHHALVFPQGYSSRMATDECITFFWQGKQYHKAISKWLQASVSKWGSIWKWQCLELENGLLIWFSIGHWTCKNVKTNFTLLTNLNGLLPFR